MILISYLHIPLPSVQAIKMVQKDHLNFKYKMRANDCIR